MTKITTQFQKTFIEIYNDLNEAKKGMLRLAFLEEHGYSLNSDTFYKKLNGKSLFAPNEQRWLCKELDLKIAEVSFPTKTNN